MTSQYKLKQMREDNFKQTLATGVQRRLTQGVANCGSGHFPFIGLTGGTHIFQPPQQMHFSNVKGSINIGSSSAYTVSF